MLSTFEKYSVLFQSLSCYNEMVAMPNQNPPFVKKFDFRGVYNQDINDSDAFYLAFALIRTFKVKKVLLGWDTRASSKTLALNFIHALRDENVEVSYLDKVPIDYVTAGAHEFDFDLSIMFTASHNPWSWTGLLIHTKNGESLQGDEVQKVVDNFHAAKSIEYSQPQVELSKHIDFLPQIEKIYAEKISELIPLQEIGNFKVVVDIGDGSGSRGLTVLEKLLPQVNFVRLNDRQIYDEQTPHQADPSELKNMQQVIDKVKEEQFDCGFAFDSDGDRVLAVDENGTYLNGSILAGGLIQTFVMLGFSNKTVGYAVEVGPALYNIVIDLKKSSKIDIKPIPVGRSLVRKLVQDGDIEFGAENVGHFYAKDFFMTDSAVFSLAGILYWMSMNGKLSKLGRRHPDGQRVQGSIPLDSHDKDRIKDIEKNLLTHFNNKRIETINTDGTRFEIYDGEYMQSWCAMRKSGYEAKIKYYFGSLTAEDFNFLEKQFEENQS